MCIRDSLDDGAFDGDRWHPDWGAVSSRAYHAPVGGLTANYGSFAVTVRPGAAAGDPVGVEIDPPVPYLVVANRATTGHVRQRSRLVVDRKPGARGEIVSVDGSIPAGGRTRTFYRSVVDPTRYAGAVLRMQLEAVGVTVGANDIAAFTPRHRFRRNVRRIVAAAEGAPVVLCLLYTSPSPRDRTRSRMPSSA